MFVEPALNWGSNGRGFAQGAPFGPESISNADDGSTGALPDHGENDATVLYVPHNGGVDKGALADPKKCSSRSLNGSCGVFSNVETNCPVTGSTLTFPASFTSTPAVGSSATIYSATGLPNGFAFCPARYAPPTRRSGNSGVVISTVATLDASGHDTISSLCNPTSPSEHANRPSAAPGFNWTPAGNVTVVSFTLACAKPTGFSVSSCGTWIPTVNPVGVLAAFPSGATLIDGSKFKRLHPSNPNGSPPPARNTDSPDTRLEGASHESASTVDEN